MNCDADRSRRHVLGAIGASMLMPTILPAVRTLASDAVDPGRFAPEIGVCTSIRNAAVLEAAGASYIEDSVRGLLMPQEPESVFEEHLRRVEATPLPVRAANGFLPGSLKCVGPDVDHEAVLVYAEIAFRRAQRVGIRTIVFGSSGARSIPDGFDRRTAELQFAALLGKMAPLAEQCAVVVAIEPLNDGETNFINTVPEGAAFVEATQHPNVRLLADIYHMLRMEEAPDHIHRAGSLLRHIHIAEKRTRSAPGVEDDDFRPYLQALMDAGYRGRISIECRWRNLAEELPVAVRTIRAQVDTLQRRTRSAAKEPAG